MFKVLDTENIVQVVEKTDNKSVDVSIEQAATLDASKKKFLGKRRAARKREVWSIKKDHTVPVGSCCFQTAKKG